MGNNEGNNKKKGLIAGGVIVGLLVLELVIVEIVIKCFF